MSDKFDIVIVGNGVLGVSTAYALLLEDPTLKIAVVGPRQRSGSGTLAAGAMLNCFSEVNKFTLKSKPGYEKFKIAKQSISQWPTWLSRINAELPAAECVTITPGTFVLLNTRSGNRDSENFLAIEQTLKQHNEPYEAVNPGEIPGICPFDDSRPLRALYLPNEGCIDPHRLLNAIEKVSLKTNRITFVDAVVNQMLFDKEKMIGIKTQADETLKANIILLTAGAYSQTLLEQIPPLTNRIPKILSGSGCSLVLKAQHAFQHVVRSPNRSGSCGIHILPYANSKDLLYMGASNNVCLSPKTNPRGRDVYYLLERAMEQFNQNLHKAEILEWRVGNRPVPFDTFPLIGQTSVAGLWLLTGTYRDGIHSSPVLAASIAKEMLAKRPLLDHSFQPERHPIAVMSRYESIAEFVDQYISAGYEHSMKLPKLAWATEIKAMICKRMESLYEALEIDIGLSPDLLFMFHQRPELIPTFKQYYQAVQRTFAGDTQKIVGKVHPAETLADSSNTSSVSIL